MAKDEVADPETQTPDAKDRLASGRQLPNLVFVTSRDRLRASTGPAADEAVRMIEAAGLELVDIGADSEPWKTVASKAAGRAGIVLLGGYNVVPSVRLDVLPPLLRTRLAGVDEPDDFMVWSDEPYGDADGDGLPDIPVSRVPDGRMGELLLRILCGSPTGARYERFGLRNVARPYADAVYSHIRGSEEIHVSEPTTSGNLDAGKLDAKHLYLILHGSCDDLGSFWGECPRGVPVETLNVAQVGQLSGAIVLAGCCWSALTVEERAHEMAAGTEPTVAPPDQSLALTMLNRGAAAVIGCTGAHYSPGVPGEFGSDVLHNAFWRRLAAGSPPAKALFEAKIDFIKQMPYSGDLGPVAVHLKTWRQFKCLGLGW